MDTWRRRFPITHFVATALVTKARSDDPTFSRAERALYVASTFWAAVAGHRLAVHLGPEAEDRMRVAAAAFASIGAADIARALRGAVAELPQSPSPAWLQERAELLETRLLASVDRVDDLIAQFVADHMSQDSSSAPDRRAGRPRRLVQAPS